MRKQFLTLIFGLCAIAFANAQSFKLPSTFASGMVIQRESDVTLWGWCASNEKIRISASWSKITYNTIADQNGKWSVNLTTPKANSNPQTIKIVCRNETIVLNDILIGDVWFVGGQSNMQMNFRGNPDQPVENAQNILLRSAKNSKLRLFRVNNGFAINESDTVSIDGRWYMPTPENIRDFSVVGYIFGEKLLDMIDIPIGLVQSAHGGSSAEAWLDRKTIERYGEFDLNVLNDKLDNVWYCMLPTVLYNKMLKPLLPMSIKGVIWYQGESNVSKPEQYKSLFPELISSWRKHFNNENMPFYYVQIAPYNYADANSAELREAQLSVMQKMPNVGMAVTLDVGEADIIHPARKEVIGERLAFWALNHTYGIKALGCRGPEYKSMDIKDGHVFVKFDFAPNGLSFYGKSPVGFEIAGEDRKFYPAEVKITPAFWGNEGLEIWNDNVKKPVAVRYGYTNYVDGCLYNTEGLPASSFRTDTW